jgi:hypothetical protein
MALRGRFISRENNRAIRFPSRLNQEKIKALIAKRKREVKHNHKRNTEDRVIGVYDSIDVLRLLRQIIFEGIIFN